MLCKLLHYTPLTMASNAIRQSHDNHNLSDSVGFSIGEKDTALIDRVGNKMKHSSTLEFLNYVYEVEMSTKTLLAFSRHRIGISLTMRSTRYTTQKNKGKHEVQSTAETLPYLEKIMSIVDEAINDGLTNDELSLMLPQAYIYKGQIQFNARSLQSFLRLRTKQDAHFQIREFAHNLFNELPEQHKYLFEDCIYKVQK